MMLKLMLTAFMLITGSRAAPAGQGNRQFSSSFMSSSSGDNQNSRVYIIVANGNIMNHSSGGGMTSIRSDGQSLHVQVNGQGLTVNDVQGPYVVTNEVDGVLKTRPLADEDVKYVEQARQRSLEQQQMFERQMQNMWRNMAQMQSNMFANMASFMPMGRPMMPMMPMMPFNPMPPMAPHAGPGTVNGNDIVQPQAAGKSGATF
ncbi:hypothetical protein HDE_03747 [Halotydeus destructor]|nr:hypothetical protein HDE_03747 [Halotydeus destructor]